MFFDRPEMFQKLYSTGFHSLSFQTKRHKIGAKYDSPTLKTGHFAIVNVIKLYWNSAW